MTIRICQCSSSNQRQRLNVKKFAIHKPKRGKPQRTTDFFMRYKVLIFALEKKLSYVVIKIMNSRTEHCDIKMRKSCINNLSKVNWKEESSIDEIR
ncbi:hypothetical protein L596_022106 [Steinernema carpocapsae]|uniref:Uncharacterized protein n=1 Tax=Steinernema carpocapsae TaxID=34508 RepID=A0A4V6A0A6_STECR|nr:hypothetical protein L596_022106 [Steinernema carpocapsae]